GSSECVRCIDDMPGEGQDSGCGAGAPRCDQSGTAICVGCETHTDCNDQNPCTSDACTAEGQCALTSEPLGTTCAGGICNGIDGSESCVSCVDDQSNSNQDVGCSSGAPFCDTSGEDVCAVCIDDETGNTQDSGCGGVTPFCDGGGCVECLSPADCDDGVSCTDDACVVGSCTNTPNDGNCGGGSVCQPMECDATLGCQQLDISTTVDLISDSLRDGSFENGGIRPNSSWTETGAFWVIAVCESGAPCGSFSSTTAASHGDILAWFGGVN